MSSSQNQQTSQGGNGNSNNFIPNQFINSQNINMNTNTNNNNNINTKPITSTTTTTFKPTTTTFNPTTMSASPSTSTSHLNPNLTPRTQPLQRPIPSLTQQQYLNSVQQLQRPENLSVPATSTTNPNEYPEDMQKALEYLNDPIETYKDVFLSEQLLLRKQEEDEGVVPDSSFSDESESECSDSDNDSDSSSSHHHKHKHHHPRKRQKRLDFEDLLDIFEIDPDEISLDLTTNESQKLLVESMDKDQLSRYEFFRRTNLNGNVIKRLVNNATGQSNITGNFAKILAGVGKVFVGEIVEKAKEVQRSVNEWKVMEQLKFKEDLKDYEEWVKKKNKNLNVASGVGSGVGTGFNGNLNVNVNTSFNSNVNPNANMSMNTNNNNVNTTNTTTTTTTNSNYNNKTDNGKDPDQGDKKDKEEEEDLKMPVCPSFYPSLVASATSTASLSAPWTKKYNIPTSYITAVNSNRFTYDTFMVIVPDDNAQLSPDDIRQAWNLYQRENNTAINGGWRQQGGGNGLLFR
ncbi:unnamed protein product [Ambrosiozyma monospora]|uniref:Unnamed protein product n=1 Tax=Ambrosiozyma monospora TaxID=43982 RepID=A0A9W6Z078_AMBMO|nr:unnamed protein product [Ambrosiozyma monospora]